MRGRDLQALAFAAAFAAILGAQSGRAAECGTGPEGFNEWLTSFKQVAIGNGVSPVVVEAALGGVAYNPTVKAHDHGVAAFGHNFGSFAASHVSPGMVARGKALLNRYAAPLAEIEQRPAGSSRDRTVGGAARVLAGPTRRNLGNEP
jgi:membrane-bound lytic murein transglycosylase B